jgi:hypothetical protein
MSDYKIYKEVGKALSENTFDWEEAEGGWPDVNWLIVNYLLRNYDDFTRHKMADGFVAQVKNCLAFSIDYSEQVLGVKIYRGYTDGGQGKRLAFITPDPDYKEAKEKDYSRIWRGVERKIVKAKTDVERRLPGVGKERLISDTHSLLDRGSRLIHRQRLLSL